MSASLLFTNESSVRSTPFWPTLQASVLAWSCLAGSLLTSQAASAQGHPAYPAAQLQPLSGSSTTYTPVGTGSGPQQRTTATTTLTFLNSRQGWFSPELGHTDRNLNYIVGQYYQGTGPRSSYRNFFTFPLTGLDLTGKRVVGASLSIADNSTTTFPSSTVTYVLHDVSTPTSTLIATSEPGDAVTTSVYNDLGTGQSYGSYVSNTTPTGGRRVYTLGPAALADIAARAGQDFSVGGMLLEEQGAAVAYLFGGTGLSGLPGGNQILTIELADVVSQTITTGSVGTGLFCANRPFAVPFTATGNFAAGNVFSVQLSNAAGSFAAPTTIGTLAGTTSGTIFATIPLGTPVGNGYRVRVVSSTPAVTGTDNGSDINLNSVSVLTVPANQTVATTAGQCSASVSFAAATTNQATVEYTLNGNPITSPYTFPVGVNTVTVRAVNVCGTANGSFTVTVQDRQAPTIRAAGFITALESNGTRTIEAADVDWGSTDCSGIASMTISPRTFTCANIGPNNVTLTVTDGAGNSASETVTVFLVDNTAPTLRVAGFQTQLQNGTRTIFPADIDYGSFDNCGSIVSTSISPRTFTCANVGPNIVTFTATDNAGNISTQTVTVVITADATCSAAVAAASKATSSTAALGETNQLEAYPNPAKEQATLRFKATQTGPAQVQVYNSLGRLVATLYNEVAEQGRVYERTFTGTSLPAGLYTCRFIQQDKSVTQRLVISK